MNASVRLLESALPTSVNLHVAIPAAHPSAQILGTERMGSGTLVDPSGLIVTVNYVALGAESITVTLVDDTTASGELVAQDFYSGIAIVRIDGGPHPAARCAAATALQSGQDIFILASIGHGRRRVSTGVIMSLEPFDAYWEYSLEQGIMTTALNPGLGGAGLFTASGTLAGVVSLDFNEVGRFTFAIPAEQFTQHRDELLQHGRRVTRPPRAWVGLYCYVLREHVVVAGVLPGAPGEQAGLKPGDVIISVDGERVPTRGSLYQRLWQHRPGGVVTFQVFRNNAVKDISVQTGDAEVFFA